MDSPFWWQVTTADVHVAFTSVAAGNLSLNLGDRERSLANRRRLVGRTGDVPKFLNQAHSAEVCNAAPQNVETNGDAWVTSYGIPIAVLVADCLPVLLTGRTARNNVVNAAAHAGRPGLLAGILENTVSSMRTRGAHNITAWIGPAACGRCYEIPGEMVTEIAAERPAIRSWTSWGTPALDLRAEAHAILESAEVRVHQVVGCTIEDPTLFSHRRAQRTGEPEGRLAGIIWPMTG